MAKKKKQRNTPGKGAETAPEAAREASPRKGLRSGGVNMPLLVLSMLGAALAAYLTVTTWMDAAPVLCDEGSSCDLVQNSRWGTLLGLPMSFWGMVTYLALGHVAFRVRKAETQWKWAWSIAIIGFGVSVYLTWISLGVIGAACTYCLISLGIMTTILVVVTLQRPRNMQGFSWPSWGGQGLVGALVVAGVLHLHFSGVFDPSAGPEEPYTKGLAIHLKSSGAEFYGAFW